MSLAKDTPDIEEVVDGVYICHISRRFNYTVFFASGTSKNSPEEARRRAELDANAQLREYIDLRREHEKYTYVPMSERKAPRRSIRQEIRWSKLQKKNQNDRELP
jgi:hypothetical protein